MAAVGTHLNTPAAPGLSRLCMMQARFRENIMLEKQTRLLELAARQEADREDMISRVTKSSANSSLSSSMSSLNNSSGAQGRVRKMFEERRSYPSKGYSPKGFDKGNPLEPLRKEIPRGVIKQRGNSVDRGARGYDEPANRSRSLAPAQQRINRGDSREPYKSQHSKPAPTRSITHHKSTSSLLEKNNGHHNGYSNGYASPPDPSSTKSSPGPREPPAAPRRGSYNLPRRSSHQKENEYYGKYDNEEETPKPKPRAAKPPPRAPPPKRAPLPRKNSNFLTVEGNRGSRSRSPSPSRSSEGGGGGGGGGLLGKLGFNNKKSSTPAAPPTTRSPKPPPTRSGPKDPNLSECKICGRCFAPDRVEKHQDICKKAKQKAKKRKIMDPSVLRTKGTEAESYVKRGAHLKEVKKKKPGNWRKQHEEFIATIRAAKGIKGYVAPPVDISDYIKCPHCGRNFSEAAAERHIPKCVNITSNKGPSKPSNGFRR